MAVTRGRIDKQSLKSTTPRSLVYTDLANEQIYFAPPTGADYVLKWDDTAEDLDWLATTALINIYNNDGTITGTRVVSFDNPLSFLYDDTVAQTSVILQDTITINSTDITLGSSVINLNPSLAAFVVNDIATDVGSGVNISPNLARLFAEHNTTGDNVMLDLSDQNGIVASTYTSFQGLKYFADYSANFTALSLVTKDYVDTAVAAVPSGTNIYNSDGTLTGNRILTGGVNSLTFDFNDGAGITSTYVGTSSFHGFDIVDTVSDLTASLSVSNTDLFIQMEDLSSGGITSIQGTADELHISRLGSTSLQSLSLTGTGMLVTDSDLLQGMKYAASYAAYFATNPRSIPDVGYVQTLIAASPAGTVTSVALSLPSIFSVSGSPVTTSGTLTGTLATQTANTIFAGPTTGGAATPTFRALVAADITAGGGVTGTGTATRVAFWSGSSTLSSNANLYWDNTNGRLGIRQGTPLSALHVLGEGTTTGYIARFHSSAGNNNALLIRDDGIVSMGNTSSAARLNIEYTGGLAFNKVIQFNSDAGWGNQWIKTFATSGARRGIAFGGQNNVGGDVDNVLVIAPYPSGRVAINKDIATDGMTYSFEVAGATDVDGIVVSRVSNPTLAAMFHVNADGDGLLRSKSGFWTLGDLDDLASNQNPSSILHLFGPSGATIDKIFALEKNGGFGSWSHELGYSGGEKFYYLGIGASSSRTITIRSNNAETLYNVGINKTTPTAMFEIVGQSSTTNVLAVHDNTGTSNTIIATITNRIGLGISAPLATLHLKAGSTAANSAPVMMTSGALMTAPQVGAWEFLTDRIYFTQTTGPTRQTIAYLSDITTVVPTGVVGQIPFYGTTTALTSEAGSGSDALTWDSTNNRLGISSTAPSSTLHLQTDGIGNSIATSHGLTVINTTAATVSLNQASPAIRWEGTGWKTNATAGSQTVGFRVYIQPATGAAAPTGLLTFQSGIAGAYAAIMYLDSGGNLGVGQASPTARVHTASSNATTLFKGDSTDSSSTANVSAGYSRTVGSGSFDLTQTHSGTGNNCIILQGNSTGDIFDLFAGASIGYTSGIDTSDSVIWKFGSGNTTVNPSTITNLFIAANHTSNKIGLRTNPHATQDIYMLGTLRLDLGSDATGDVYYRNSGGAFTRLAAGTNGHVLTLASGIPSWAAASGADGNGIYTGSGSLSGSTLVTMGVNPITFSGVGGTDRLVQLIVNPTADQISLYAEDTSGGDSQIGEVYVAPAFASIGAQANAIPGGDNSYINFQASGSTWLWGNHEITMDGSGITITDGVSTGLVYAADYSTNILANNNSIPDIFTVRENAVENYSVITSTTSPVNLNGVPPDYLINQGSTQATFTFSLPASPVNGEVCKLTFNNAVTVLTITAQGGVTISGLAAPTSAAIGTQLEYKYYHTITSWIRVK